MKKIIRKFLSFFGYDFIKVYKEPFIKKDQFVKVGSYNLKMPAINPLIKVYKVWPDFNGEIAKIFTTVKSKYQYIHTLDIGANTGDTAAIVKTIDSNAPVICVEGDPSTYTYLKENTRQFQQVTLHRVYLGESEQTIEAEIDKKGWNSTILQKENGGTQIHLTTLDALLEKEHKNIIKQIKFVKIDTEGYDTLIIRGGLKFIEMVHPILYFEYNRDNMKQIKEEGLPTLKQLKEAGYEIMIIYDDKGRFLLSSTLQNFDLISDLHQYADGTNGLIYYLNICLFHKSDNDIGKDLSTLERKQSGYNIQH